MSNEMPEQPKTIEMPKVEVPTSSIDAVLAEVRACRADIGLVTSELNVVKGEVRLIQEWRGTVDNRLNTGSIRAKSESQTNAAQDAVIATLVTDMAAVKTDVTTVKTDVASIKEAQAANREATAATLASIQSDVKGFFTRHPALGLALIGLVTTLATAGTAFLNARLNPPAPAPVVQQVAK